MTTTYQLSDKGGPSGQGILLIKVEAPDEVSPETAWNVFAQAVQLAGLDSTLDDFDALVKAKALAVQQLGAQPVFDPAQHIAATQQAVAAGGFGGASPPQLPAAAQAPAVGQPPSCVHGQREFISGITKSGKNAGMTWKAWACPANRDDPSKCEKEWIRD